MFKLTLKRKAFERFFQARIKLYFIDSRRLIIQPLDEALGKHWKWMFLVKKVLIFSARFKSFRITLIMSPLMESRSDAENMDFEQQILATFD